MRINKIFSSVALLTVVGLAGCTPQKDWFGEYTNEPAGEPAQIISGTYVEDMRLYGNENAAAYGIEPGNNPSGTVRHIAAILPLSGTYADIGNSIRSAIEMAYLQRPIPDVAITFYDNGTDNNAALASALGTNPEIIIGPVFANDVRAVRGAKPGPLPVLAFSSDSDAIGDGVMTMALMPSQSIETIVRQMAADKVKRMVILAPDSASGKIMASTALRAAEIYNTPAIGLYYYKEKDSEAIKNAAMNASMYPARSAANTRAREVLADILTNEELDAAEKNSLTAQLEKISKTETLGAIPFDGVLFLGDGPDSQTLASFLRYYGVGARDARFYGTTLWEESDIITDYTMRGARFATLPVMSSTFAETYEKLTGAQPGRLASFGYDATNLATGMITSGKPQAAYLLDPSGYRGIDGLIRMTPYGMNERALRIVQLNGTDTPTQVQAPARNFMTPLYHINAFSKTPAQPMELESNGINPNDFIQIPARFAEKYASQTYGATVTQRAPEMAMTPVVTVHDTGQEAAISAAPEFQPVALESVQRTLIDAVEIQE